MGGLIIIESTELSIMEGIRTHGSTGQYGKGTAQSSRFAVEE